MIATCAGNDCANNPRGFTPYASITRVPLFIDLLGALKNLQMHLLSHAAARLSCKQSGDAESKSPENGQNGRDEHEDEVSDCCLF